MKSSVNVLFEDNHLLIVEKPAGMLTQGNHKEPGLEELLREKYTYLHCVHRLDKPVSGLVIFAKSSKALSRLNASQRESKWIKKYIARIEGRLSGSGTLEHHLIHGDHKALIDPSGKLAVLDYTVLEEGETSLIELMLRNYPESSAYCRHQSTASSSPNPRWGWPRCRLCISAPSLAHLILPICVTSVIEITLHTGRYHQIRAQFGAIGHPILGDHKYGSSSTSSKIALHHSFLSLPHPVKPEQLQVHSSPKRLYKQFS